jgi:hypothetical protein
MVRQTHDQMVVGLLCQGVRGLLMIAEEWAGLDLDPPDAGSRHADVVDLRDRLSCRLCGHGSAARLWWAAAVQDGCGCACHWSGTAAMAGAGL